MMRFVIPFVVTAVSAAYTWHNVKIGGGGGFTPGIVFNPTQKGIAYARTDIGGLYRLNSDDSWTPLTDFANSTTWHDWGVNALASDPVDPSRVYIAVGMYTNSWDPNNGSIMRSSDYGATWKETAVPFKFGGNQPGRGTGERLAIDPQNNKVIYLAAPSGHGLYKSIDQGVTFAKVASFTPVGDFVESPSDTSGYGNDPLGLVTVVFDTTSPLIGGVTSRIFVAVATITSPALYVSNDGGETWTAPAGQPAARFPHRMKFSTAEKMLYMTIDNTSGPYDNGDGKVYKYNIETGVFTDITPAWEAANSLTFGYGGLSLDAQIPGTLMVAADNLWYPDVQIFRSNDSGTTWSNIWDYNDKHYTYNTNKAPWISASRQPTDTKVLGWMVESLEIDPFDSNHWLYGTGLTIYGGHNLKSWPSVLVESLADGIEEESVQDLICPPGGAPLLSAVGDDSGFQHLSLTTSPAISFVNPEYATTPSIDYAGLAPMKIVRIGNSATDGVAQMALSSDGGATWAPAQVSSTSTYGGKVAYSADGSSVVWRTASRGALFFKNGVQSTITTLPNAALLKSDKVNSKYFYAVDQNGFYVSKDGGATFAMTSTTSGYPADIKVHPSVAGDIWFSTNTGLYHSTDFGKTWSSSPSVTSCSGIAMGKGAQAYPNVYGFVTVDGTEALMMSADKGMSWTTIQVPGVGFGSASANCLAASQDTAGLVFVGTNGRGIYYGEASDGKASSSSSTTTSMSGTMLMNSTATSTSSIAITSSMMMTPSTSLMMDPTTSFATTPSTSILVPSSTPLVYATTTSAVYVVTSLPTTLSTKKSSYSPAKSTQRAGSIPKYAQCGGQGWTGIGTCTKGLTCAVQNKFYSQCV